MVPSLSSTGMQIFPSINLVVAIRLKGSITCWFSTAHGSDTFKNKIDFDSQANVLSPHYAVVEYWYLKKIVFIIFKLLINNFLCTVDLNTIEHLSNSFIWSWFLYMKSDLRACILPDQMSKATLLSHFPNNVPDIT